MIKLQKKSVILLFILFFVLLSIGCNNQTTEASFYDKAFKAWEDDIGNKMEILQVNKVINFDDIIIEMHDIGIAEKGIVAFLTVKNSFNDKISFYPSFGNAVINNLQLVSTGFIPLGIGIDGEIESGTIKTGAVAYMASGNKNLRNIQVNTVKLNFERVIVGNKIKQLTIAIDF